VLRQFFDDEQLRSLSRQLQPEQPSPLDYYPLPGTGERFPVSDAGLTPRLTPRPADDVQFLHGLLEGIARIERDGYRLLQRLGAPYPADVRTVGGGAQNPAWSAIRQRLLGVPLEKALSEEAAYGAALLSMSNIKSK
jgi:sugar (pentulose or hexulose) kinase